MTSQQDTELEKILDMFFDLPYPDYNMGLLPDEEGYDEVQERRNYEEGYAREEIAKALTSWKDKEVMASYRQGYNDNSRDCYCDSPGATEGVLAHRHLMDDGESHNIKPDVESLQSQGGKNE